MTNTFSEYSTAHAIVRIYGDRRYGHIDAVIRNMDESHYRSPRLRVSCQIGSTDPDVVGDQQRSKTYAWNFGVSGDRDEMTLSEMEFGVKVMRRIEKKLRQWDEELGAPETFSEYCSRVLVASGVKYAFVIQNWGGSYGSLTDEGISALELGKANGKSLLRSLMSNMEKRLIDTYKKAM